MPFAALLVDSGLVHMLASLALASLVLNCWFESSLEWLLKIFKFAELVGANMLAVTNIAICLNLALIVHVSKKTMAAPINGLD